jgi:hypothetical protein
MIAILLESFDGFAQLLKTRRVAFDARRTSLAPKRAATRKLDVGHNHRIKAMLSKLGILALIHLLPWQTVFLLDRWRGRLVASDESRGDMN